MTLRSASIFAAIAPALLALVACSSSADNAAPNNCSTNKTWSSGDQGSPSMHPGGNCIECHSSGEGPHFSIAGTVMNDSKDDTNCDGVSGVTIALKGSDGQTVTLTSNGAGNFYSSNAVATPYTVTLTYNGKTRQMTAAQTDMNCANCHTAEGANGAPGRILLP